MIIAIDGPAGSGKSTVAKFIAKRLNYRYIDTGSMYRAVAWSAEKKDIDLSDENAVGQWVTQLKIEFVADPAGQQVKVNGENATGLLKNEVVGRGAAKVAAQKRVREILVAKQQEIGESGNVVMDGRDIGTQVFPNAELKFFMDADAEERGKRRYLELKEKNLDVDLENIIAEIKQRDHEDRTRAISPLCPAEDAIKIDTTKFAIEEVIDKVMEQINLKKEIQN
ncbi:MAG TPA: (d)CMP kinase [Nitrospina sp.]|jgi:cytidylate kinase|nr:(d)CMP kinase [Nitrospina sp.]|tara:strand:+ start:688 stop:1359 length:672 start_codon:yes stop_codon:yes gene_type:complete